MGEALLTLLDEIDCLPVTVALRKALRIAKHLADTEFADWCRRELGGYLHSNPAMMNDIIVPEYRTVVGQHADIFGRVLRLPSELAFIGETRLRFGTAELETLAQSQDTVVIHDPTMCKLILENLDVEVSSFRFSPVDVTGILSAIRTELQQKLLGLSIGGTSTESAVVPDWDDIIELRPNFYGIGVDLRALWRRYMIKR